MNRIRFGALLVSEKGELGFYLSHRVVLTVPGPGRVRGVTADEFACRKVFTRDQVAVSFFSKMTAAIRSARSFQNSREMMNFFFLLPKDFDFADFSGYLRRVHGAGMEDFSRVTGLAEADNLPPEMAAARQRQPPVEIASGEE